MAGLWADRWGCRLRQVPSSFAPCDALSSAPWRGVSELLWTVYRALLQSSALWLRVIGWLDRYDSVLRFACDAVGLGGQAWVAFWEWVSRASVLVLLEPWFACPSVWAALFAPLRVSLGLGGSFAIYSGFGLGSPGSSTWSSSSS